MEWNIRGSDDLWIGKWNCFIWGGICGIVWILFVYYFVYYFCYIWVFVNVFGCYLCCVVIIFFWVVVGVIDYINYCYL